MGARQRRAKAKYSPEHERSQDTIRLINQVLATYPLDLALLRKIAAVRGLVTNEIRARVWPILLGVSPAVDDPTIFRLYATQPHRDSSVVDCDVERSLWSYTEGWSDEERVVKRNELRACINAVVCKSAGDVFYYQGLHDVASVLLFVAGESAAMQLLDKLTNCQLKDCTRSTLDAVLELLTLLMPILQEVDAELHQHIQASEVQPYYALSWFITWFAHNVPELDHVARIFDVFLSSHPMMPLYFAAVVMKSQRDSIMACPTDMAEMHRLLNNLPILKVAHADQLAREAVAACKGAPPEVLLRRHGLHMLRSSAALSKLVEDHWVVPSAPPEPTGDVPKDTLGVLVDSFRPSGTKSRRRLAPISTGIAILSIGVLTATYVARFGEGGAHS